MNRLACVAAVVLLQSAYAASFPVTIRATRLPGNPVIREQMLPGEDGASINGPSLIRVPEWVVKPLGRYYLYFANHAGKYIRLAYADRLEGPWTVHPGGVLRLDSQQGLAGHLASPEAVVDREGRRILLFVHGKPAGVKSRKMPDGERDPEAGQRSIAAVSTDGLHFEAAKTLVGPAYLRVFRRGGYWYALNQRTLMRTAKLGDPFAPVADILGDDIAAQVDPLLLKEPGAPQDRPKNGADR